MDVSVVIPTYNRGAKLTLTIQSLLENDVAGVGDLEILVVDDGSTEPASPLVEAMRSRTSIDLRCIHQSNAGPAAARNTGFRASHGAIIVCIDDDILAPADLIRKHVEAHKARPGSVICGRCPLLVPEPETSLFRYVNSRGDDHGVDAEEEFLPINSIASGQISFERESFSAEGFIYRDDLATPAAEEFELAQRLQEWGVPIYLATRIVALHDHPVTLDFYTRQAYKYGLGYAEASVKYPQTLGMREIANVLKVNGRVQDCDSMATRMSKALRELLSRRVVRDRVIEMVKIVEWMIDSDAVLSRVYKVAIGIHFFAGVRDGLTRFGAARGVYSGRTLD